MTTAIESMLLGTSDAAQALAVSVDTIRGWADSGRLPCVRTRGGVRVFRAEDVDRLGAERESERPRQEAQCERRI